MQNQQNEKILSIEHLKYIYIGGPISHTYAKPTIRRKQELKGTEITSEYEYLLAFVELLPLTEDYFCSCSGRIYPTS